MSDLDTLRQEIESIDAEILSLISKRMQTAEAIGRFKRSKNLPIKDFRREKKVIDRYRKKARELGFFEELAAEVSKLLISHAVDLQDQNTKPHVEKKKTDSSSILVIGGKGGMGHWFANFFDSMGHEVSVFDPSGNATPFYEYKELTHALSDNDIVCIATPIHVVKDCLTQLQDSHFGGVIFEVASLKDSFTEKIKELAHSGFKVASIHPMFGPTIELLTDKNILFCDGLNRDAEKQVFNLFQETTANSIRIKFDDHDRYMSYVLGSSHFLNMVFGRTLARSQLQFKELMSLASSTFRHQLSVTTPVVHENQDLYFDIQAQNPHTLAVLDLLSSVTQEFREVIDEKDRDGFKKKMKEVLNYFSS